MSPTRLLGVFKRRTWIPLLLLGVLGVAATASAQFTIVSTSGSVMYTDFGNGLDSNYLAFKVTNIGGSTVDPVWAQLDTHGGNISNVGHGTHQIKFKMGPAGDPPILETAFLAGETKGVFFMVQAGTTSTTPQTLTVNLFGACSNSDPVCAGGTLSGPLGSQNFSFTVADTIQANSNKVNTVVTIPANPVPGDLGNVAVSGCTGTVGALLVEYFSPVTNHAWVPDLFEFVDSEIVITGYPGSPYKDIMLIPPGDIVTTDHCYTDTFTFVINGFGSGSVSPNNFIASGQPVKHTTPGSGSFDVVIPELDLSVVKTQTSPLPVNNPLLGGTNVTYHIAVHNAGPPTATNVVVGDSFTVGSATFVSITNVTGGLDCSTFTALPGQCTLASMVSGANASFDLTVTLPNDGTTSITNTATVTSDVQDSNATNDSSSVTTTICPAVDVSVVKTTTDLSHAPISTIQGGTGDFLYHVVVANGPGISATNVLFTDTLPAGVTLVSSTAVCSGGGAIATNDCNLGTIAASSNVAFDIRVTPVDSGLIDNTADVTQDQCDSNLTNNESTVEITVETNNTPTNLEADREGFPGPTDTDGVATVSDVNRVFEPNETVRVDPVWLNNLDNADPDVTGTASNYTGPVGATYNIPDPGADYGAIPAHAKSDCNGITAIAPSSTGTGDCYEMQALQTDPLVRPHLTDHPRHWDTTFDEDLSTGEHKNWTLHIGDSFLDTPRSDVFYRFIETIFHNHITIGCGTGVNFCPLQGTIRTELSAFIARSVEGRDSLVPVSGPGYNCISGGTSLYTDVPPTHGYCKYINDMKAKLIITGCSIASQTTYCPTLFVIRGDMATYVARAVEYLPPNNNTADPDAAVPTSGTDGAARTYDCSAGPGPFLDVTNASPYCKYVGLLWVNHIVDGDGAGHFFPLTNIKRDEEAKILANAFVSLPLYGPLTF